MKPNKSLSLVSHQTSSSSPARASSSSVSDPRRRLSFQQEDLYSYVTVVDGPTNEGTKVVDDV